MKGNHLWLTFWIPAKWCPSLDPFYILGRAEAATKLDREIFILASPTLIAIVSIKMGRLIELFFPIFKRGSPYLIFFNFVTKSQFEAKKFYTSKCVNSWQKLSCNKTVCKILHCVKFPCVLIGKVYTWLIFLHNKRLWWLRQISIWKRVCVHDAWV